MHDKSNKIIAYENGINDDSSVINSLEKRFNKYCIVLIY